MLMEIGRLCLKIAGRDANRRCVIIEVIDERTVLIDGQTRRRRCNIAHLEPLDQVLELPKGASHAQVRAAFEKLGLAVLDSKPRPATERPRAARGRAAPSAGAHTAETPPGPAAAAAPPAKGASKPSARKPAKAKPA